ncbi:hypothetical protein FK529_04660 [Tsukamurella asaccharolytica]|uniref:4Fe-4S Wbl-type domain-containing protein n=1 Tax=Tsukamurella asaccharolytica TaxID=2592067 RepID=A0A5C5RDC1_9ACTN|nr:hypothetical protein [Tsukamurella asaccharolytica]TWS20638.1 hypothetical protein FK529_04660 [Tsukamurella asaccharolytica]
MIDALAAILAGTPKLDGAACDRQHALFDAARPGEAPDDVGYRHGAAATICQTRCPALEDCTRWLDSLPARHRPHGVVAGRIPEPARIAGRPRKDPR